MSIIASSEPSATRGRGYVWRGERQGATSFSPGTERERITAMTRAVAVAALEVLAGSRSAVQLNRWVTPEIVEKLRRRAELLHQRRRLEPHNAMVQQTHRHSEVLRQRVCHVAEGAYEVALVIRDDARTRALVLRAERRDLAWRVTVLDVG